MQNKIIVKPISERQRERLVGEWKNLNKQLKNLETKKYKIHLKMYGIEKKVSREYPSN